MRIDKRKNDELRPVSAQTGTLKNAHGSVLFSMGNTEVLASVMIEEGVPAFMDGKGQGWLTAEYAMLPASTPRRKARSAKGQDGRATEISRLIGRSLRSILDLSALDGHTIYIDCDVLSADGGTRTAAISGAYIALMIATDKAVKKGTIARTPVLSQLAAVSAGIVDDEALLDLCYKEDSGAQADMNLVAGADGSISEVQISGEKRTVSEEEFATLLRICKKGIGEILQVQRNALEKEGVML
ncbi:MAG: ribonuclease PH [Christensenellaceae bacterium]